MYTLTIHLISGTLYTVKKGVGARELPHFRREYLTGNHGERYEPRSSRWEQPVTTAESVVSKEPKELLVSHYLIRLHEVAE